MVHTLLARQIKRYLSDVDCSSVPFESFLSAIDQAYDEFDSDRRMLERTMELSSRELMRANSEMRAVLQSFPELFIWIDERDCIAHVEAGDETDLYQPRATLIGRRIQDIPDRNISQALTRALASVRESKEPCSIEYTLELKGSQVYEARLVWLVDNLILAIVRNVTDQRDYESSLLEAKIAAERAAKAKSEFLANMSHEIRTPLTAILGFSALIADTPEVQESQAAEHVSTVRRNAEHLLVVINDVLDFSQIEAGKMKVEAIETDVDSLARGVFSMLELKAHEKQLDLRLTSGLDETVLTKTDPNRIRQILVNLVGNAVKFTETGAVEISVRFDSREEAPQIVFEVSDTGIGLEERHLETIFQSFSQADTSHARRFGGTGLGLTISKRLAKLLGGDLSVESRLGEGSTFRLSIPFVRCDKPEPSDPSVPECEVFDDLTGLDILLAEDGLDNQRLIGHVLRKAGASVTIVSDGIEAVEAASERRFDVILMDMQMPRLDGYGASTAIRTAHPGLPIIALTAHALDGDRQKCIDAGCSDYQTKPIDRPSLIAACSRAALTSTGL